jgi:hypothetical protein
MARVSVGLLAAVLACGACEELQDATTESVIIEIHPDGQAALLPGPDRELGEALEFSTAGRGKIIAGANDAGEPLHLWDADTATWSRGASLPEPGGTAALGFGGTDRFKCRPMEDSIGCYDVEADEWHVGSNNLAPSFFTSFGEDVLFASAAGLQAWDPVAGELDPEATPPRNPGIGDFCPVAIAGELDGHLYAVDCFGAHRWSHGDTAWTDLAPWTEEERLGLVHTNSAPESFAIDGKLCGFFGEVRCYDPRTDALEVGEPSGVTSTMTASAGTGLYVASVMGQGFEILRYDVIDREWSTAVTVDAGAIQTLDAIEGKIYAVSVLYTQLEI